MMKRGSTGTPAQRAENAAFFEVLTAHDVLREVAADFRGKRPLVFCNLRADFGFLLITEAQECRSHPSVHQ
jgi:hypothetical protein